ncbi:hypothetical protein VKT23_018747 [Stygiomarasmius scandens]|uniref:Uncharacterized protein n=1 Tax=Marasmiellus scandens TaxID=2682957 RepID=A0ABR1IR79_9AGAR
MVPSVTNSKTTHIPSSIYARDPSSETTNLYRKLRADLTRATQARYDELNTRPMYSGSASSSIWSHSPAYLYLSGYKHTSIDNKTTRPSLKATSISTGYYPVFQRALPPISMAPSLIANTYDFSPSPTSSDWDARSRTCCSDDDSTSDDTSVSDISFPGSPTRPFPTPCPSSPLLGPSTSPTPVTRQSEELDGTWPARFGVLPERPDVNALESLRYLINSLTDLGKRFLENNLAYQTAGTGESSSLDGIMEKAWSGWRSSASSNSSSSFSFNPVFESSVVSSSARKSSSDSYASYEQPAVTSSSWAKPGLTAPPPQAQSRAPRKPSTKRNSVSSFSKLDPRTPAYIPQATRTESSHQPSGPLIHNPNALTLFDCSCSDCHWTLLKMNGVTQGDIEKIDDEWGTLKKAAIREGVILPETAPQKDQ